VVLIIIVPDEVLRFEPPVIITHNVSCNHEPENLKARRAVRDAVRFAGLATWYQLLRNHRKDPGSESDRSV